MTTTNTTHHTTTHDPTPINNTPAQHIATTLGISKRTIERWRNTGIPTEHADTIACRILNTHPALLWPEWLDASEAAQSGLFDDDYSDLVKRNPTDRHGRP